MKNSILSLILIFTGVIFQSCQHANHSAETDDAKIGGKAKIDGRLKLENEIQTAIFIKTVAMGDMLKVTLGKLAVEKANRPDIKRFGNLIVRDHKEMYDALKALTIAKGLKLPDSLSEMDLEQVQQMSKMESLYFEKLYLKMMIEDYNKDIELFMGAIKSPDTAVSNFARRFLPGLEIQRENAVKIRGPIL